MCDEYGCVLCACVHVACACEDAHDRGKQDVTVIAFYLLKTGSLVTHCCTS